MNKVGVPQTDQLFAVAERLHPALLGEASLPQAHAISFESINRLSLQKLYQYWQQQHPEAGTAYWSARCWTLLIWQPVYLLVAAVHGCQRLPNLSFFQQGLHNGHVSGFCFTRIEWQDGDLTTLINAAIKQLKHIVDKLFCQCEVFHLRRTPALRLTFDTLLSALVNLPSINQAISHQDIRRAAKCWLKISNRQNQSGRLVLDAHQNKLVLQRSSCCFDYRRAGGSVCVNCPRQGSRRETTRAQNPKLFSNLVQQRLTRI